MEALLKAHAKSIMIVGLAILMTMVLLTAAASACMLENEPGKHRNTHGLGEYYHPRLKAEPRVPAFGDLRTLLDDEEGWDFPYRQRNFGIATDGFRSRFTSHFSTAMPLGFFGAKWDDLFEEWDLSKLIDQLQENPTCIWFGGVFRPAFVALVFPLQIVVNVPPHPTPAPIPAAAVLLGSGLAGLGVLRMRNRMRLN
jgi:hypothetical protein